mmetsp:Transcript_6843/g.8406  ORF Transcript_6843/g.8406 Transcript_6843/m.8406 type:complete len:410 (+) Transcript_6843:1142-2371(+)
MGGFASTSSPAMAAPQPDDESSEDEFSSDEDDDDDSTNYSIPVTQPPSSMPVMNMNMANNPSSSTTSMVAVGNLLQGMSFPPPAAASNNTDGLIEMSGFSMAQPPTSAPAPSSAPAPTNTRNTVNNNDNMLLGMEGLTMAPIKVENDFPASQVADIEADSSEWNTLVRSELGGGLLVRARYLRGLTLDKEVRLARLDPRSICLQLHFQNQRTDAGILRKVRMVQRNAGSGGPKKTSVPTEISQLGKDQVSSSMLVLDFGPSVKDKDGAHNAKFEFKSDRASNAVNLKIPLVEMMTPLLMKKSDYQETVKNLKGQYQQVTESIQLSAVRPSDIPKVVKKNMNMAIVGNDSSMSNGTCSFAATLPGTGGNVLLVSLSCGSDAKVVDLVIHCENAITSNTIKDLLKKSLGAL